MKGRHSPADPGRHYQDAQAFHGPRRQTKRDLGRAVFRRVQTISVDSRCEGGLHSSDRRQSISRRRPSVRQERFGVGATTKPSNLTARLRLGVVTRVPSKSYSVRWTVAYSRTKSMTTLLMETGRRFPEIITEWLFTTPRILRAPTHHATVIWRSASANTCMATQSSSLYSRIRCLTPWSLVSVHR